MNSSKNLRGFLQGIQFCLRAKGVKINVFSPTRSLVRDGKITPNFSIDLDGYNLFL